MVDKMTIMGKELSEMIIAGRVCHLHEQASPQCLLVQPLGDHENDTLPNEIEEISAASPVPFVMVAFEIADWERDLMPWSDMRSRNARRRELARLNHFDICWTDFCRG